MHATALSDDLCQQAIDTYEACGKNLVKAANALNLNRSTFQNRLRAAGIRGFGAGKVAAAPTPGVPDAVVIESLRRQLREAQGGETLERWAKQIIQKASDEADVREPAVWLDEHISTPSSAGIPTLFLSDLHWGEVVRGSEIGDINSYDLQTAQERLRSVVDKAILLLRDHVVGDYPGIVVPLGGDMISGSIHDELEQTNEGSVMQQTLDMFEHLQTAILRLVDEFGRIHLPCVTGNHGRSNKKWQAKQRAHLSYEWLLYQFLVRAFSGDSRVTFQIPDGPDADYDLLGTKYRLVHGDQFRSGDGIIGPIGPVTRGALKRGRMASGMGQPFDVMILGHWHTLTWGSQFIINGSLKGFDEYAMSLSITPEPPAQAMWLTTEKHGRTIQLPVYA